MRIHSQTISQIQPSLVWMSVWALAALYGAFTLSWVIYRIHLPALLQQLEFSPQFAPTLLLIETLLAIAIDPLAGWFSDRLQQQHNSRFKLIGTGVFLAATLFIVLATMPLWISAESGLRWLLPVGLVIWAIAMSLFRSPALALLKHCANPRALPFAASFLTLMSGFAAATNPLANTFILNANGIGISAVAALLLLGTAAFLSRNLPAIAPAAIENTAPLSLKYRAIGFIFGIGLTTTLAFRLATEAYPKVIKAQVIGTQPPLLMGLILLTLAIAALPMGILAVRIGNQKAILLGLAGMTACLVLIPAISNLVIAVAIAVLLGISYSLISNGTLPLALNWTRAEDAGLAVGAFFAGVAAATSLLSILSSTLSQTSILTLTWSGIIPLLLAALCVTQKRWTSG
jgi:MFS family permease